YVSRRVNSGVEEGQQVARASSYDGHAPGVAQWQSRDWTPIGKPASTDVHAHPESASSARDVASASSVGTGVASASKSTFVSSAIPASDDRSPSTLAVGGESEQATGKNESASANARRRGPFEAGIDSIVAALCNRCAQSGTAESEGRPSSKIALRTSESPL